MEKEEINNKENTKDKTEDSSEDQKETQKNSEETLQPDEKSSPQEELDNLKDKLARTFAEMENQRRRYEKEKEDAFEYGGFAFAKEALNLLDNLERSKISLENDEALKNTEALKKVSEHFEIINKDEESLGIIFTYFMLETILLGKLMKLNPFNQPAVESIKKETKRILS